ncbi:MAG: hypothetical protein CSYNP_01468 [Syntrophus sp. SKADARSKE-3]|nr:hypothetical protein [Syntrophus sp. SKADARSKE-3]
MEWVNYVCNQCEYMYEPPEGDPSQDISKGVPFEKLPEEWTCPQCGASLSEFSIFGEVSDG